MKKLLLLLAAVALVTVAPSARAFEKDSWHDSEKTLEQLDIRMDAVNDKRQHFGASPKMRDQIAELHEGIRDLTEQVKNHDGDPKVARKRSDELSDLMSQVESEYSSHIHHDGVVIHLDRGW